MQQQQPYEGPERRHSNQAYEGDDRRKAGNVSEELPEGEEMHADAANDGAVEEEEQENQDVRQRDDTH